jgi:DNA polymerase
MRVESKQKAIDELNTVMKGCTRCRLCRTRKNVLVGEGNLQARLMLIAQAPGENEDREGRMFIGPSGQVLDELLEEAGISRDEIYMTNLIKCKLPQNRKPKQDEIKACSRFLEQEIVLIDSEVIAPLGYYATRYLLSRYKLPIPKIRVEFSSCYGRIFRSRNQKIFPLPHPASLLYNQSLKPVIVEQYKRLKAIAEED